MDNSSKMIFMDKKTTTIVAVVVVAVVVIAAVAFVMMNNGGKDYNAQELAEKFVKDYDGDFGEFEIATGGTESLATLTYTTVCLLEDGTPQKDGDKNKTRELNFQIYHYETKEAAQKAYDAFIKESKNGSKGKTLIDQTDKLGMADKFCTVLYAGDNFGVTGDNVKEVKAKDFGCDKLYILYAAYHSGTSANFTQAAGAVLDGKNVLVFNQTTLFDLYLHKPIKDTVGSFSITQSYFEEQLMKFAKAAI